MLMGEWMEEPSDLALGAFMVLDSAGQHGRAWAKWTPAGSMMGSQHSGAGGGAPRPEFRFRLIRATGACRWGWAMQGRGWSREAGHPWLPSPGLGGGHVQGSPWRSSSSGERRGTPLPDTTGWDAPVYVSLLPSLSTWISNSLSICFFSSRWAIHPKRLAISSWSVCLRLHWCVVKC